MNREIKFRGQRVDDNQWVYGDLIQHNTNYYRIMPQFCGEWDIREAFGVIPETIGQYTGLKDVNGSKIYGGDMFKVGDKIFKVIYQEGLAQFVLEGYPYVLPLYCYVHSGEVIGEHKK